MLQKQEKYLNNSSKKLLQDWWKLRWEESTLKKDKEMSIELENCTKMHLQLLWPRKISSKLHILQRSPPNSSPPNATISKVLLKSTDKQLPAQSAPVNSFTFRIATSSQDT